MGEKCLALHEFYNWLPKKNKNIAKSGGVSLLEDNDDNLIKMGENSHKVF